MFFRLGAAGGGGGGGRLAGKVGLVIGIGGGPRLCLLSAVEETGDSGDRESKDCLGAVSLLVGTGGAPPGEVAEVISRVWG